MNTTGVQLTMNCRAGVNVFLILMAVAILPAGSELDAAAIGKAAGTDAATKTIGIDWSSCLQFDLSP